MHRSGFPYQSSHPTDAPNLTLVASRHWLGTRAGAGPPLHWRHASLAVIDASTASLISIIERRENVDISHAIRQDKERD